MMPWFRWCGLGVIAVGALTGAAGGSSTLAWAIGTSGGWCVGLSLIVPLVARRRRLTWSLVAVALCTAFVGGIAYLLVPSDATWWLGQLTAIPAVGVAMYFSEGRSGNGRHFDTSSGKPEAPPGGGGAWTYVRSSSATVSMCGVCGNMSTGRARTSS